MKTKKFGKSKKINKGEKEKKVNKLNKSNKRKTNKSNKRKTYKTNKTYESRFNYSLKKSLKNTINSISKKTDYFASNHYQHKLYDRKNDISKFQYIPKLKGGKYVDKGGFGCVIKPALPCSRTDINLDNSVSKIIKNQSDTLIKELKISNILQKIDPGQKFYITINKYCFIDEIPSHRTDIKNVKYKDDNLSEYSVISKDLLDKYGKKKKIDKRFCDIDIDLKPVNLIMPYAGTSLSSVMKTSIKGNDIKAKMHQMFIKDLKIYFKHLIVGLIKMHNNRIVYKDIKQKNIMLEWDSTKDSKETKESNNNIMAIRYIDFGLSAFLTDEYCKDINNIELKGTPYYISPELFICVFIIKYKDHKESYQKKKIMQYINKHIITALSTIGEKGIISKIESTIDIIFNKIKYLYEKDRLLLEYFGSDKNKFNGYLQKSDVYALGLSIYETLYKYTNINIKKNNENLYDLLLNMIEMNPDKRYNIIQCLSHSYFTGK